MLIHWLKCMITYPQWHDDAQGEAQHKKGLIHLWYSASEGRGCKGFKEIKTCYLQAATLVIGDEGYKLDMCLPPD